MPKTWKQKLSNSKNPEVKVLEKDFAGLKANTTMLISTPKEIQEYIQNIPSGERVLTQQMRADLAKKHGTDGACPVTTGIFLRIVSEVALEEINEGKKLDEVAPFWRVVDPTSNLASRLPPFAKEFITSIRKKEGIRG